MAQEKNFVMEQKERPIVHLFCNAHIDPVWMWSWEEGAREAISTFRTAVNLLDEFPEFVFNHNESLLYEWVEEYDPPLFERIREYVKQGRWNITGGWYLQPDINLTGGETLVRLILEGRLYFQEKFSVRPPVAYNFDTFGHAGSIPQLLRQAGFEIYIHCRPTADEMQLPAPVRRWEGIDGSQVIAVRPDSGWYGTPEDGQAQAQARKGIKLARERREDIIVTWGLGDHGGGATAHDLNLFREILAELRDSDVEVRHSTPEAYLERIRADVERYPVHKGELQRTLMGCYTSVAPIKREMREGEALLASAERWAVLAWWRYGFRYPAEELNAAWKRLMFNTFHDVLCGSLLEDALPGVHDMYGYAGDIARRIIARSQHYALPNVMPAPDTIPVYVLNPHSTRMRGAVGLNFLSEYRPPAQRKVFTLYDDAGRRVPCQDNGGNSVVLENGTWQPYIGFVADVPPLTARRYEIRFDEVKTHNAGSLSVEEDEAGITAENQWWRVRFSRDLAAPVELVDKASGRNLLKGPLQLFAMQDVAHAWGGHTKADFNVPVSPLLALSPAEVGAFTGMEGSQGPALRVIAQGDVFITVECLVGWQHTRAALRFKLFADLPHIDIDTRLYMQARRKMIKLVCPFDLPGVRAICEVPYGVAERPADATEYPYARWLRLESAHMTVGIANNGQNGLDVSADGVLGLSISRGAVHCHWDEQPGGLDTSRSFTFMDQTQIDTRFRLIAGQDKDAVAWQLIPLALELNQPLERFFVYYPPSAPQGAPADPGAFLQVEPPTVILGALKKAERDDALIIRLVESIGQAVTAQVRLEGCDVWAVPLRPHEIKTLKVTRSGGQVRWQETSILEE
jgi:alpha-mannosidase